MKKIEIIILLVILFLSIFIYSHQLSSIPPGFYIDEAMPAYSAYSILKTAKDEYGKLLPVAFRFFGSYNTPLFIYSLVPAVSALGLSITTVRLTSVVFGILLIPTIWFLIQKMKISSGFIALLGTFIFAISPWNIFYARIGYEVTLAFFLSTLAATTLWLSFKNNKYLPISALLFSLATYAAYTQRFLVPIFLLFFLLVFRKQVFTKSNHKALTRSLIIILVTQIPNFFLLTTPAFFPKSDVSSSSYFLAKLVSYFSPRSLFFTPDPDPQRSIPELSTLYFWLVVPYIIGAIKLFQKPRLPQNKFILLLLFTAPIPASLTKDPFSTHRAMPLLLPVILIITMGLETLSQKIKKYLFIPALIPLIVYSFLMLYRGYFVLLPQQRAMVWGAGVDKLAEYILSNPNSFFIIDTNRVKPPYAALAFYLAYPPEKFQKQVDQTIKNNYYQNPPFSNHFKFANLETRPINWGVDIYKKVILVGDNIAISQTQAAEHSLEKVFEVKDPLDKIVFEAYKTNPKEKCLNSIQKDPLCEDILSSVDNNTTQN